MTILPFLPALSAGWVWDDEPNFLQNETWRGLGRDHLAWMWSTAWMGHYQPLSWMTLGGNWLVGGMDASGYHATNLALHALSAALLVPILRRLVPTATAFGVLAGALFFAIHPLRVESVVWITERRDVLAMVFVLGALNAWLRWVDTGLRSAWVATLLLLCASLLAKAHAVTFPVVLLILDVWPLCRALPLHRRILEKLPFFVASAACALAAIWAQSAAGAMSTAADRGLVPRLLTAAFGASRYPGEVLLPLGLTPSHSLAEADRFPAVVSVGALVIVSVVAFATRRRWPGLGVAWALYLLILAPVSGILQSGTQGSADRYTYFSTLPFAFLVAAGASRLATRALGRPAVAAALVTLAVGTWRYTAVWHDSLSLWSYAADHTPDDPIVTTNLAAALEERGRLDEAVAVMAHTVDVSPDERAGYRYGRLLHLAGRDVEAERVLLRIPEGAAWRPRAACLVATIRRTRGDEAGAVRAEAAAGTDCAALAMRHVER